MWEKMSLKQISQKQRVINKMKKNNGKREKKSIALIQIFILITSIVAFTNIISAQTSSSPLSTNVIRKAIIKSNESDQESEENTKASITGAIMAKAGGGGVLATVGEVEAGHSVAYFVGEKLGKEIIKLLGKVNIKFDIMKSGLLWAGVAWVITFAAVWWAGGHDVDEALFWANAIGASIGLGFTVGNLAAGIATGIGLGANLATLVVGWPIGILTALITFWRMTLRTDQRAVVFDCKTWQSQTGGADCNKCNGGEFPCTLYKCKSLGQACELINEGDNARCIYVSPTDTTSPKITPREDSLLSGDYSYEPIPATNGVEVKYKGGCLPSFESFTFGIELDKEGTCRIEDHRTSSFDDMQLSFGSGLWDRNHTQLMFFPGQANLENEGIELPSGGNYEYYVRCENVNGYANVGEFLFKFCIDPLPDISPPLIQGFNLLDNTPIRYFGETEAHETNVRIYVNEPLLSENGGCRWSHSDKSYEEMEEMMISCGDKISEFTTFNAQISYSCSGTLTGLQNEEENKFYFRCSDSAGNMNTESKELTLIGSRALVIDSVEPSGIIKGSSNIVKIKLQARTSAGYENGIADCYYSSTGNYNDYTEFKNTRSYEHSDELYLSEGDYTYHIQCFDMAGNVATATTELEVEADFTTPLITRAYYEGGDLKIITSEPAECVYDITSCSYNFEDGLSMISGDDIVHSVAWDTSNNLYIKCQDEYGNKPAQNKCNIILRPFEFFEY